MDIVDPQNDAEEEQTEEAVVAFDDPGIDAKRVVFNCENGEKDCKGAKSDRYNIIHTR